ncbi:hypothetical protein ACLESD_10590 [Pyxidicoccus sp. 3LFB2]
MATDPHREHCRRQHRILGHFLCIQTWQRGLDCAMVVRPDLERLLKLQHFKASRLDWLREDVTPWFPYQAVLKSPLNHSYSTKRRSPSLSGMLFSRVELSPRVREIRSAYDELDQWLPWLANGLGTRTGMASLPDETTIVTDLALFASGLAVP